MSGPRTVVGRLAVGHLMVAAAFSAAGTRAPASLAIHLLRADAAVLAAVAVVLQVHRRWALLAAAACHLGLVSVWCYLSWTYVDQARFLAGDVRALGVLSLACVLLHAAWMWRLADPRLADWLETTCTGRRRVAF